MDNSQHMLWECSFLENKDVDPLVRARVHHVHFEQTRYSHLNSIEKYAVGNNKLTRCISLMKALESFCKEINQDRPIAELLQDTLSFLNDKQSSNKESVFGLIASLKVDGYELRENLLVPITPGPISLAREVSALEEDLQKGGRNYQDLGQK